MRKLFSLLMLAVFCSIGYCWGETTATLYYESDFSDANSFTFSSGFTLAITGNTDKKWGSGSNITLNSTDYKTLKNSNGAQNTLTAPSNYNITAITFYVVSTSSEEAAKLSEFEGKTCTDAVSSLKDFANPTVITKALATPANSVTFTFNTKQVYFIAVVTYESAAEKHKVTYALNGGSGTAPTQADVPENSTFTVASGDDLTAPTGKDFKCWNDGTQDYAAGATYTMGTTDVTLTAQWQDHVAKFTVVYKDGDNTLGTEMVKIDEHPTATGITTTKDLYTFNGWSLSGVQTELTSISAADGETVTLIAIYTANYAVSIDLEAEATNKTAINDFFANNNYASTIGTKGGYDNSGDEGYHGYKFKDKGDVISFIVQQGDRAVIHFGHSAGWTVNYGSSSEVVTNTANSYIDKTYSAKDADMLIKLTATAVTSVINKITIEAIPAQSDDATLSDLKVAGTSITGFDAEKTVYYVALDYGTTTAPTVSATANDANASVNCIQADFSADPADMIATVRVTAEDVTTTKDYEVRFSINPELGEVIAKATITGKTSNNASGIYKGTMSNSNQDLDKTNGGYKLGGDGQYVSLKLSDEYKFKEGDVLEIYVNHLNGGNTATIYNGTGDGKSELFSFDLVEGLNYYVLPASVTGLSTLAAYRASSGFNPNISSMAVYRLVSPLAATDGTYKYATFSTNEAVEFTDNASIYTVKVDNEGMHLDEITNKQVPANTGVLIKSSNDYADYKSIASAAAFVGDNASNMLYAASIAKSDSYDGKYYMLAYGDDALTPSTLGFYYGAADGKAFTSREGSAYLAVPTTIGAAAHYTFEDGEEIATATENIENTDDIVKFMENGQLFIKKNGVIFNALGQIVK